MRPSDTITVFDLEPWPWSDVKQVKPSHNDGFTFTFTFLWCTISDNFINHVVLLSLASDKNRAMLRGLARQHVQSPETWCRRVSSMNFYTGLNRRGTGRNLTQLTRKRTGTVGWVISVHVDRLVITTPLSFHHNIILTSSISENSRSRDQSSNCDVLVERESEL